MLYVITCTDKKDSLPLRMENREAHLQYLADAGNRIKLAGPRLTPSVTPGEDGTPMGSLIIIDADSDTAAMLFANHDPYNKAGLFESVTINPWKCVVGDWQPKDA